MTPGHIALWTVLGVALVISVVTDVLRREILDVVTYPLMAVGLGVRLATEGVGGLDEGLISGLVSGVGLALLLVPGALRGRMGWGDVKLMGGVGAVLGFPASMAAAAFISLVGAAQAVVSLLWQGAVWDTVAAALRRWAVRLHLARSDARPTEQRHIPYGVAIALGTFWALWWQQQSLG
ncbi:type IV leader peptidase family protein [Myxococcus stipitatus DSM 14675]|uniref:Type IV leader peptidase family protein n=1 Tax=Myxococcus stipitatus (strain DSM 14675 / JCM 12634 / Mx s8) TaxID=1278073 RepID=L7UBD1_MYXSD|nr:A24 family peptidase [Myxococcus stipitatus]AGC44882.1 type IV leader peptidase family protein [Myxococcus stipitatus DSM 14675]